jgi:tetratricopeptide (TPR) repeat protein
MSDDCNSVIYFKRRAKSEERLPKSEERRAKNEERRAIRNYSHSLFISSVCSLLFTILFISKVFIKASPKLRKSIFIPISFFFFLLLPVFSIAQDRPPGSPVLPFQQDAVTAENEDQLAMQFFQDRNYEKAVELYSGIYRKRPTFYNYTYYFYSLVEIREFDEARKLIKNQQKLEPGSLKYMVDLGYVYFREGNTEKARKQYEDAIKHIPADANQVYDLANAFYSKGEFDYAIRTYKKGRESLPGNFTFGFELAGVYERTGNFRAAMEEYLYMLSLNKNFESTVRDRLQTLLATDEDNSKNETFRNLLLERIQKEPEKSYYSELLWWYSIQQKDFELALIQARALDRRLKENGDRIMELAELSISNGKYDVAEEAYKYLISKGPSSGLYEPARRELLHTRYLRLTLQPGIPVKEYEELQKSLNTELARWERNPDAIRIALDLAHLNTFYLNKPDEALDLLDQVVQWKGLSQNELAAAKLELADIHVYRGDLWTATVLYQQIYRDFKNDATGQEAKFRNARLSYYMGEFKWAKAQLDILKAATSKFIANDAMKLSLLISNNYDPDSNTIALGIFARAEIADFRNKEELALKTLDSIPAMFNVHPILDNVIFRKGEIYLKEGNYLLADSMFAMVIRDHPVDIILDEAIMSRATIHETNLNDKTGAMAFYQELLNNYPGSIFIPDARKRYRTLRGDNLQ